MIFHENSKHNLTIPRKKRFLKLLQLFIHIRHIENFYKKRAFTRLFSDSFFVILHRLKYIPEPCSTLDKIYHASFVLKEVLRRTDLIVAPQIVPGTPIYLKPENLQLTGSFKVRGAYYKISQLSDEEKAKGVIACSAGNHAQGVALGATKNGIKSLICLPAGAPLSKVEATKNYGAEVCLVDGVYDDAYQKALQLKEEMGYTFVHPFDDENVIAGQGTIGIELLDQLPDVEAVIVPVGGGGLISGVAYAIKSLRPNVKIYGVQASGAPSMVVSLSHKHIERLPSVKTIADGIAVKEPGTRHVRHLQPLRRRHRNSDRR